MDASTDEQTQKYVAGNEEIDGHDAGRLLVGGILLRIHQVQDYMIQLHS